VNGERIFFLISQINIFLRVEQEKVRLNKLVDSKSTTKEKKALFKKRIGILETFKTQVQ